MKTATPLSVIALVDNHDMPRYISMRFEPRIFGAPFDGFTALTRIAMRLAKFGEVTTNEVIGILEIRLFSANIVTYSMMASELRIMCKQVFDREIQLTTL